MSTPKHTPGPWSVAIGDGCFVVETGHAYVRFVVHGLSYTGDQANARLIAAAPELLRALIAGPSQLHTPPAGEGPCRCSQCSFVMLRDAAIAKATGSAA